MQKLLCATVIALIFVIFILLIKIYLLHRAAGEIETGFAERVMTDTNTLIDISCRDRYMRSLADAVNRELRELRKKRHRYEQGDMELKNAVTNISHDLRTPLTAICGYLDMLEQEEKSEAVGRYIEIIRNRTDMLKQLTEELFRYSVIVSSENNKKCKVAVGSVLEEAVAAFYAVFMERGIEPDIKMPECGVIRELDPSALSRVFENLLNNVLKYSDGDLEIVLSETGEITFSNEASGLSEVQVGKLFDRFYTVDNAHRSTGLGLAIARMLVEQMGGTIAAYFSNGRLFVKICL